MSDARIEGFPSAEALPVDVKEPLGNLLLALADNKRLLGMRYADWILGAPSLEAGIACSAMAQDEWGHGRIVYAMLRDFGFDPAYLEHERQPEEYRSIELLDEPIEEWSRLLVLNLLVDTALSVVFEAMEESRFEPILYKVRKLLDEERFHFEHGRGWTALVASIEAGRESLASAFAPAWEACLSWFGPADDELFTALHAAGITASDSDELRARWLQRVGPVVEEAGLGLAATVEGTWQSRNAPSWASWDPTRRRNGEGGPDPDTLARVRGDRNRQLLMD
jgi:phenylacetate-CoA oxygenase PaaI subunit